MHLFALTVSYMIVIGAAFFVALGMLTLSFSSAYTPAVCGLILLQKVEPEVGVETFTSIHQSNEFSLDHIIS